MKRILGFIVVAWVGATVTAWAEMPAAAPAPVSPIFSLGEVLVLGADGGDGDGTTAHVSESDAARMGVRNLSEAAALAPGVTWTRNGVRNEAAAFVRGFDTRQVPLFMDGIPVYVSFDGNIDMGRFDLSDLAELSIDKGFSPAIYGPNTLGGAINLVSRRPTKPEELSVRLGAFSGEGVEGALRAGVLRSKGYAQAGVSFRERDHYRVSRDFVPTKTEDGGRRENSDFQDVQVNAKLAWTPGDRGNEFAVGFVRHESEKGVPTYSGVDENNVPRFWRYSEWLKNSVFAVGHMNVGEAGYLKPRVYFDTYENTLLAFDDATYSSQKKKSSWTSVYDDYTFGGSVEGGRPVGERHDVRIAAHFKQDVHREHLVGGPQSLFKDETVSLGAEDRVVLAEKWAVVLGADFSARYSLEAHDATTDETFSPNDNTAFNPQVGLFYTVATGGVLRATVAQKSRFPTLKDRYSARIGKAIANPDLAPETAHHFEVGYRGPVFGLVSGHVSGFYSRLDDTIQQVERVVQGGDGVWLSQFQNVGESEQVGAEVGVGWSVWADGKLGADVLVLKRKNTEHPEIKLTDVPEQSAKAYLEWRATRWLTLVPNVEVSSSRYSTSAGIRADGFWLANLDVAIALPRGFELRAGIRNLLDENIERCEGYPEEGRNVYANLKYSF